MAIEEQAQENPYSKYENTVVWRVVEEAVLNLVENQDIKLTTVPVYVIGYICQQLEQNGIVKKSAAL